MSLSEHESNTARPPGGTFSGKGFRPFAASIQIDELSAFLTGARHEEPISYSDALSAWLVTREEDIRSILRDAQRFSSDQEGLVARLRPEARALLEREGYRRLPPPWDDPSAHARARRAVMSLFSREAVAALEPMVRRICADLVESFIREGQADLVKRFTYPLPIRILFEWMGLPPEMMDTVRRWTGELLKQMALRPMTAEEQKVCVRSMAEMQNYVSGLIAERVDNPREDGMSVLAQQLKTDAGLSARGLAMEMMRVVAAGHETTTRLLSRAVRVLVEQPELWRRLRAEPHLLPPVVEELLRLESPVQWFSRLVATPVVVGGVRLPSGAQLMLILRSSNRDEQRPPEPERCDPGWPDPGQHLSFGKGLHLGAGSALAQLEARVALEVLTRRLAQPLLVEPPQPLPGRVRQHARLLLAWDPVRVRCAA